MAVLGIDLGINIGWFLGDRVGPVLHGSIALTGAPKHSKVMESTCAAFHEILSKGHITGIAVEQPFLGQSYYPARRLLGQLGMLYLLAPSYGVGDGMIEEIPIATGKLSLAGHGNADKDMMIAAAAKLGYLDLDEHAADACGCWYTYQFGRVEAKKRKPKNSKVTVVKP